jgi:hypothetical protein
VTVSTRFNFPSSRTLLSPSSRGFSTKLSSTIWSSALESVTNTLSAMEPSLSADSKTIINWCLDTFRPTRFYTERLGLPQTEYSKSQRGTPEFEGNRASQCKDLYKLVMKAVNKVADDYHTKEELNNAVAKQDDLSIDETTRPLLTQLGPVIWSESEPYMTVIRPSQYPQHLKFSTENDREKWVHLEEAS